MNVKIIVIGDEILLGQVTDTNSGSIARAIRVLGWNVIGVNVIPDNADSIFSAVKNSLMEADIVITTGGLGPTKDDITKATLLRFFGGELIRDNEVTENIRRVFSIRGLKLNGLTENQALVPSSCEVIQNLFGTAPVMWFEKDGHVLVSMPGVPFETEGMLPVVLDKLKSKFTPDEYRRHATMIVTDITESDLATKLDEYESTLPDSLHLAYLPTPGLIRLRLDGCDTDRNRLDAIFDKAYQKLVEQLGKLLLFEGDATAAEIVINLAKEKKLNIAAAESCTGGTIASRITSIPGASEIFKGGIVSYSNEVKCNILNVDERDITKFGAVSEQVVRQMADGVAEACNSDCSIATSGIAGPGGGTPEKPVGTVWMALHTPQGTRTWMKRFPGDRHRVIDRAATTVLVELAKYLKSR